MAKKKNIIPDGISITIIMISEDEKTGQFEHRVNVNGKSVTVSADHELDENGIYRILKDNGRTERKS